MGKIAEMLKRVARGNPESFRTFHPRIAEEVELESYEAEEHRDKIRAAVLQKRAERIKNLFGTENYDLTRARQQHLRKLRKQKPCGLLSPVRL